MQKVNKSTGGFRSKPIVVEILYTNSNLMENTMDLNKFFYSNQNPGELEPKQRH